MPLGDAYRGSCCSDPSQPFVPQEEIQRDLCNFGYARGRCDRFRGEVPGGKADAVRFSIADERLIWVRERDHSPVEHGVLELEQAPEDAILAAQARAFVASHRRRLAVAQATVAG